MPNMRVIGLESSGHFVAVTPSDSVDLAGGVTRGLYIGGAGNVSVDSANGDSAVIFTALAVGMIHSIAVKRVRSTNTTATSIIAIYSLLFAVVVWGMHGFI